MKFVGLSSHSWTWETNFVAPYVGFNVSKTEW